MTENKYEPDPSLEWAERVLIRVEVGSTAHGTGLDGVEDYDEIGVMSMPWDKQIGIPVHSTQDETINYRPGRAEGERSEAGDYDLVVHSARKFAHLCAQGNPNIAMVLFGPLKFSTPVGELLRFKEVRNAFWSQQALPRYLGYAQAQRQRLEGSRGGRHTNRPELVAEHGFDTKYAMHMVRLGYQGIEYITTGKLTLPIPAPEGEFLRAIRMGQVPLEDVFSAAYQNEKRLKTLVNEAPPQPNYEIINDWLKTVFVASNGQRGLFG